MMVKRVTSWYHNFVHPHLPCLQHMIRLLNVLSSFPAVYELLGDVALPTKQAYGFREIPSSMAVYIFLIL